MRTWRASGCIFALVAILATSETSKVIAAEGDPPQSEKRDVHSLGNPRGRPIAVDSVDKLLSFGP